MNDYLKRVLVVDDNEAIRALVSNMFLRLGLEATSADGAEKGFNLFLKKRFDLVITDFEMPGMNGIDLATQIKEISPSARVVLMTGQDKSVVQEKVQGNHLDHVLFKPFRLGEIKDLIKKMDTDLKNDKEFRKYPRKPCNTKVYFTTQNEYYEGLTKNISRGGVFIEIKDKFNVGQSIKLVIPATESEQNILRKGQVVHDSFSGFGIKFNGAIENGRTI
jgi:DNA-binding NtrC family response regulator